MGHEIPQRLGPVQSPNGWLWRPFPHFHRQHRAWVSLGGCSEVPVGSPGFLVQETNPIGFSFMHAPERSSFWLLSCAWRWGTSSSLLPLKIIIVSSAGAWAFLAHSPMLQHQMCNPLCRSRSQGAGHRRVRSSIGPTCRGQTRFPRSHVSTTA